MAIYIRKEKVVLHNDQENLTLLHISDVHVGFSSRVLNELKSIVAQQSPDLVVCTGDYYDLPKGARLFRAFLVEVAKAFPIVFIWGNHDLLWGKKIAALLSGIPNCSCVEDAVYTFVSSKGFTYHLTSWDNRYALRRCNNEKNIVLVHNPKYLKESEFEKIDLILAGHLHGGQAILFTTKTNTFFPGNLFYRYCTNRTTYKHTTVVVSKGLGDTLPIRINCPREVVAIQIK